jgi:pimeloyl-ACP methyl ester carboxylesterase
MHGWPGFWWEWYKCIDRLAKHFDVILPDFRGYRDSEKPNLADISKFHLDLVTEDQANLLHYLKIPKAYVVGHDYSALVMHKFVRKPAFDKCCPETGKLERNKSGLKTKWK